MLFRTGDKAQIVGIKQPNTYSVVNGDKLCFVLIPYEYGNLDVTYADNSSVIFSGNTQKTLLLSAKDNKLDCAYAYLSLGDFTEKTTAGYKYNEQMFSFSSPFCLSKIFDKIYPISNK